VREKDFVKAARMLGASKSRIFFRHVLPNSAAPLITYTAMVVAAAILAEAGLSFIGLGVQPPYPSWGLMLSESRTQFDQAPWLIIAPGVAVSLTALAFILLGVYATRAIEPRSNTGGDK
jgi:peptide/nickel transport system permease protein